MSKNDPYALILEQAKVITKMDRQVQGISDSVAIFMETMTAAIGKVVDRIEALEKRCAELEGQDGEETGKHRGIILGNDH